MIMKLSLQPKSTRLCAGLLRKAKIIEQTLIDAKQAKKP